MDYRKFLSKTLEEASVIALKHFGKVKGWAKDGDEQDVLTEADLEVGRLIVDAVKREFPEHNVIDEESGAIDNGSKFTWVIDPIDGTSNFAAGSPHYGVMIGLLDGGVPVAGGFSLPFFNEIYLGQTGKGATCNGEAIRVSSEAKLIRQLVSFSLQAKTGESAEQIGAAAAKLIPRVLNLRASASTFDMAMVARGTYGAFVSNRGRIWDCVGPHVVIEEAGGVFTHTDGSPIDYSSPISKIEQQFSYFMASPAAHEQILAALK
jgi:myo-inositol-1(or 4)-monophosphatase